jgi:spectinomycin phosphotransferase
LRDEYGLNAANHLSSLGADANTAVYRAVADQAAPYFVKLRRGVFDATSVMVPKLLHDQGVMQIIAPLSTRSRHLWASLGEFKLTVSPFVEGHSGFEVDLSDRHWVEFGRALRHTYG